MAERFMDRLEHAWDVFRGRDNREPKDPAGSGSSHFRPERGRRTLYNYNGIIVPILTQIAVDAAGVELRHVRVDKDGKYEEDIDSALGYTMNVWPNLDQAPTMFRQDMIMTMLQEGHVVGVPVETSANPDLTGSYSIHNMRAGVVKQWWASDVRVDLYDERTGLHMEVLLPKKQVAIVENPLYSIMNEPNSTLQRLIHKLSQLDITDDRLAAGKLDIILQLPYTIKHESRLREAKKRIGDIETQLTGSKHGIGYIDSTERVTQLNRPSENNLLQQVERLEQRVYDQMGLTTEVFTGTADEASMLNYHNRTVFPIVRAIQEEFHRKFLTKTAISQGQAIQFFRDPFSLVPVSQIAEIADKFTRNEIMAPNEFRPVVGLRPVKDPEADELRNRNMPKVDPATEEKTDPPSKESPETKEDGTVQELLRTISRREETR